MPRNLANRPAIPPTSGGKIRLGFVALNDAAPLIVAHEYGLFKKFGLPVELRRELGWATIRDKIAFGELEAAHALSSLAVSVRLGLDSVPGDFLSACVLSRGGYAVTLSERLWNRGVRDGETLRDEIIATRHERPLVFGVAAAYSNHYLHLCDWLATADIQPARDVRIVVVPPPQAFRNLSAGTIDGYCVGEPWNSLAIQRGAGWSVVTSRDLNPDHAEKVLLVRAAFASQRHEEHLGLIAALVTACRQCDAADFRPELVKLLARREYLNLPPKIIAPSLLGPFELGHGQFLSGEPLLQFSHQDLNTPAPARVDRLIQAFKTHRLLPATFTTSAKVAREVFRSDLHAQAMSRHLA